MFCLMGGTSGLSSLMSETLVGIWIPPLGVGLSHLLPGFGRLFHSWSLFFNVPLDFHGRIRVVRTMFIPGALHGSEGSLLASSSLRKLRSSISKVVWSRRQPLASVGAVLGLLDGLHGCDPACCVVWFWFRVIRRYLAYRPSKVDGVYHLVDMVIEGCLGHGPFVCWLPMLLILAFGGTRMCFVALALGCLPQVILLVLLTQCLAASYLCARSGFREWTASWFAWYLAAP